MKNITSLYIVLLGLLLSVFSIELNGQVFINEFMASNTGAVNDPDNDESADWVELYNAGNVTVHIGGSYLTDNYNDKQKWQIPIGVEIPAKGFVVIWADGLNIGIHTNFKLSSIGEELGLYASNGDLIDSIAYELQDPDISFGRKTDGGNDWVFFQESTPGKSNNHSVSFAGIVKSKPWFTPRGGIYDHSITVTLKNVFGGNIYYTLDGSEPSEQSSKYSGEIRIEKNTVVRARIMRDKEIPGEVISNSYFINSDNNIGNLPVISIASSPDNFWGAENGIYVQDFKPDWEVPINIELFENDGSDRAAFNQRAGAKINGLYSWQLPQKMIGVYFRKAYGSSKLEYPLFHDRERNEFDTFALRASGNDWSETLFRDGLGQSITAEHMDVDFQGFRQCVVYVNGQYMGIHNIRSKVDQDFVIQNNNLGDKKIDMIEYEEVVEEGSIDQYAFFEDLYHEDLKDDSNFNRVKEVMDIDNFTDFIIAEMYTGNSSISHNVMAWKPQFGGKWQWILMDLDRGFKGISDNRIGFYESSHVIPFGHLLENSGYKKYFGKRLADHLFTTYHPTRIKALIDEISNNIDAEIPKHIIRWEGTKPLSGNYSSYLPISSYEKWIDEVDDLKAFAEYRPNILLEELKDYGFDVSNPLTISTYPQTGGTVLLNGLEVPNAVNIGRYPKDNEITVNAIANDGYKFIGWGAEQLISIIERERDWKFFDNGTDLGSGWREIDYNDSNWDQGQAELGYGDRDEKTDVSYGGNSNSKYITTYFRKSFNVNLDGEITSLKLDLKCDDGAVIYLNGTEVVRTNLPEGEINYKTLALTAIQGSGEDDFNTYLVDASLLNNSQNVIAVEVHQVSTSSSDISFDMILSAVAVGESNYESHSNEYTFTHKDSRSLIAIFESESDCILPEVIEHEMHLTTSCSPYLVPTNVLISEMGKLIVDAGVEFYIGDDVSFTVNGTIEVNGSDDKPVLFRSSPYSVNKKWGNIKLVNAKPASFKHVIIEDASKGVHPIREIAAISAFNTSLSMDHMVIENVYASPILARLSDVKLSNSRIHSAVTGDLINVKYGTATVENCEFYGNDMPDTDAIDYDDVTNGVIKNCVIRDFHGFNSDAIDIGEQTTNVTIEGVVVYNITDKGVSVGQQSSANIINSIFVNCDMGAGLKDSCKVIIDHCTYYGNNRAIANYEKNAGDAGGNVYITNSILSNSYEETYQNDEHSTLKITNSLSDNDALPFDGNNLFDDPKFVDPNQFDFGLQASSSCIGAATNGNIGAELNTDVDLNFIYINSIAYSSEEGVQDLEFIGITNAGSKVQDISRYAITKGFTFMFPNECVIRPGQTIYITNNSSDDFWLGKGQKVYQWESGRLSDEGEGIQLETETGIIVDKVRYNDKAPWPIVEAGTGIILKDENIDNHFGANWESGSFFIMVGNKESIGVSDFLVYPNPTAGVLNLKGDVQGMLIQLFTITGEEVYRQLGGKNGIDISTLKNGVYILKAGAHTQRIVKIAQP